jgi:hypothetical protein
MSWLDLCRFGHKSCRTAFEGDIVEGEKKGCLKRRSGGVEPCFGSRPGKETAGIIKGLLFILNETWAKRWMFCICTQVAMKLIVRASAHVLVMTP